MGEAPAEKGGAAPRCGWQGEGEKEVEWPCWAAGCRAAKIGLRTQLETGWRGCPRREKEGPLRLAWGQRRGGVGGGDLDL